MVKIIAIEEHIVSRAISKATASIVAQAYPYYETFLHPDPVDTPDVGQLFGLGEQRISAMDQAGISVEVVSYTNISQWLTGSEAKMLVKAANDDLHRDIGPWPGRFRAFATLPWANPERAADELRRCVNELGFVGALISGRPMPNPVFLDDPQFNVVWKAFTDLDVPLYVHPNFVCEAVCHSYYSGFADQVNTVLSAYGFGWHLEAGIQVLRMVLSGVFEKFPKLKVISGHWGEVVPYYLSRLDQMLPPAITKLPEKISTYYANNVWITPSGVYDTDCLDFCMKKFGGDHLIFSTDFPYLPETGAQEFIENSSLTETDKHRFASENAEKLLHINLDK